MLYPLQCKLDEAAQHHKEAQQQAQQAEQRCASLEDQVAAAEASLAEARQKAEQAQQAQQEAAAVAEDLRQQLAEAQQQVAAAAGERQEWAAQRSELQEQLAAVRKAHAAAEGKLAVARQREAQFKVGRPSPSVQRLAIRVFDLHTPPMCHEDIARCFLTTAGCRSDPGVGMASTSMLARPPPRPVSPIHLQEASKQLKVLQKELGSFVEEGATNQQKREAAEQR